MHDDSGGLESVYLRHRYHPARRLIRLGGSNWREGIALHTRGTPTAGERSLRRALALWPLYQAIGELQPPEGRVLAGQALKLHRREIELLQNGCNDAVDVAMGPEFPETPAQLVAELAALADQATCQYQAAGTQGEPTSDALASIAAEKADVLRQLGEQMQRSPGTGNFTLEAGYRLELVISGLTYPTGVFFDGGDGLYVVEGGFTYGPAKGPARILKVDGDRASIVVEGLQGPVTGALCHQGALYTAEGGPSGRISRILPGLERIELVTGLRTFGDHYTSELVLGPDGFLYFGVGTATNSGVVGMDNFLGGWLQQFPHEHDVPGRDIRLTGENFEDLNWLARDPRKEQTCTGSFKPFGARARAGEVIRGRTMANGVLYRVRPDGTEFGMVADGVRNVFGLGVSPEGALLAIIHGFDGRGNRPIEGDWDSVWEVEQGGWYGWPDFASGLPVTDPRFRPSGQPQPRFLLQDHPPLAGQPILRMEPHSANMKFDFAPGEFGFAGHMFIAQFGHGLPMTGDPRYIRAKPGFRVVRANLSSGQVRDFYVNRRPGEGGRWPERPIDVKFNPRDNCLYLVDFGILEAVPGHFIPHAGTGAVWRIRRA